MLQLGCCFWMRKWAHEAPGSMAHMRQGAVRQQQSRIARQNKSFLSILTEKEKEHFM